MPPQPDEGAEEFKQRVGEAIRSVRGAMKQGPLAELLGIDQSTLSGWESGRYMPPLHLFPVIEECCGVRRGAIVRRLGLVEDDIESALAGDPALSDYGRVAMVAYYRFTRDEFDPAKAAPLAQEG